MKRNLLSRYERDADGNIVAARVGKYGPYDAFSEEHQWYLPRYLAIDQGPIPVMIENHRTGLLWDLFMSCPELPPMMTAIGWTRELR